MISKNPTAKRTKNVVRTLSICSAIVTGVFILIKSDSFIATPSLAQTTAPTNDGSSIQSQQSATISSANDADAPDGVSADTIQTYVVKKGDTLSGIAEKFNISANTIRTANDMGTKDVIKVGQTLVILPISGAQYVVKKGDTLSGIAAKYKTTVDMISSFNDLDSVHKIQPGMKLLVPQQNNSTNIVSQKVVSKPVESSIVVPSVTQEILPSSGSSVSAVTEVVPSVQSPTTTPITSIQTPSVVTQVSPSPASYFIQPIPGSILTQGLHDANAVDFGAPVGTSVRAAATGIVIIAKNGYNGGYGNYIVIQHANSTQTVYAHLSKLFDTEGDTVTQGQIIALSGATGRVTGPHLHFEVRGGDNPWIRDPKGTQY